jgi:hypothetical protein
LVKGPRNSRHCSCTLVRSRILPPMLVQFLSTPPRASSCFPVIFVASLQVNVCARCLRIDQLQRPHRCLVILQSAELLLLHRLLSLARSANHFAMLIQAQQDRHQCELSIPHAPFHDHVFIMAYTETGGGGAEALSTVRQTSSTQEHLDQDARGKLHVLPFTFVLIVCAPGAEIFRFG